MTLSSTDWITISIYFAAVFAIGFYFSRKEKTSKDYFLAGRNVIWFAVGVEKTWVWVQVILSILVMSIMVSI